MKTNTLIYIIIVLQVFILIFAFFCFNHMNNMKMGNGGSCMNGSGSCASMMNNDKDMKGMMMNMTTHMKGKTGDELDKIFLEDMIVHHEGAVDMAKELQKGTNREELKKMAEDIIKVQTNEINMMKNWLNTWF